MRFDDMYDTKIWQEYGKYIDKWVRYLIVDQGPPLRLQHQKYKGISYPMKQNGKIH